MTEICKKVSNALLCMQRNSWEQAITAFVFMQMDEINLVNLLVHDAIVRQADDGRLGMMYGEMSSTDGMAMVEPLLFCLSSARKPSYKLALDKVKEWIFNNAPKDQNGIFYHLIDKKEIWVDSMFMAPPACAALGNVKLGYHQICGFREYLFDTQAQVYRHIWDNETKQFKDDTFWGVGNGWAACGILHLWNYAQKENELNISKNLKIYLNEVIDGVLEYLRSDGFFHNNLNDTNSFIDTNTGQMIAYVIYKGVKAGIIPEKYIKVANKILNAVKTKINEVGLVEDVCGAPNFIQSGFAAEGQAFFLLMESAKKEYQG